MSGNLCPKPATQAGLGPQQHPQVLGPTLIDAPVVRAPAPPPRARARRPRPSARPRSALPLARSGAGPSDPLPPLGSPPPASMDSFAPQQPRLPRARLAGTSGRGAASVRYAASRPRRVAGDAPWSRYASGGRAWSDMASLRRIVSNGSPKNVCPGSADFWRDRAVAVARQATAVSVEDPIVTSPPQGLVFPGSFPTDSPPLEALS